MFVSLSFSFVPFFFLRLRKFSLRTKFLFVNRGIFPPKFSSRTEAFENRGPLYTLNDLQSSLQLLLLVAVSMSIYLSTLAHMLMSSIVVGCTTTVKIEIRVEFVPATTSLVLFLNSNNPPEIKSKKPFC